MEFSMIKARRLRRCKSLATLFEKADAVLHKYVNPGVAKKNEEQEKCWDSEDKGYIRPIKSHKERPPTSYSLDNVGTKGDHSSSNPDLLHRFGKQSIHLEEDKVLAKALIQVFHESKKGCDNIGRKSEQTSSNPDLLHRFGQQSIHLEQDKALAKALIQVFHESQKGPDVQPPRNDRRTLKLSKSDEQGYGFWLQTYDFGKAGSVKKKRTFVRYVEDEGPAYLAGLRAGDVIVEVNGQNVEDIEHMKIVGLISETAKQLMLVVKFMDMVRRVELAIRLKNRQAKLKVKLEELEKLKEEEKKILNTADCEYPKDEASRLSTLSTLSAYSSTYSSSLEVDLDRLSLDTSSESGLGSLSSIADDVTVRTSKFEKRSSRVLDSIKELNCACTVPNTQGLIISRPGFNSALSNTDKELVYSDNIGTSRNRNGMSVKRTESMPVQKRNSLPLPNLVLESFDSQTIEKSSGEFQVDEPDRKYDDDDDDAPYDKILSNDDMLYDTRLGGAGMSYHQRLNNDDMLYDKRLSVDDMLYDKRLAGGDMLYDKRLGVERNAVYSDKSSCGTRTKSYKKSVKSASVGHSSSDS